MSRLPGFLDLEKPGLKSPMVSHLGLGQFPLGIARVKFYVQDAFLSER